MVMPPDQQLQDKSQLNSCFYEIRHSIKRLECYSLATWLCTTTGSLFCRVVLWCEIEDQVDIGGQQRVGPCTYKSGVYVKDAALRCYNSITVFIYTTLCHITPNGPVQWSIETGKHQQQPWTFACSRPAHCICSGLSADTMHKSIRKLLSKHIRYRAQVYSLS